MKGILSRAVGIRHHWLEILLITVFWCILWQGFTPLTVVGGLAVAVLVQIVFGMPPLDGELTLRPIAVIVFLAKFLWDMVVSGIQVSYYALRPKPVPGSSVVAVQMRSESDFFLTLTAILATLIPGSVVVEAQRSTGTLFLHVFAADTPEAVEKVRQDIIGQEERALRAFACRSLFEQTGYGRSAGYGRGARRTDRGAASQSTEGGVS